MIALPLEQAVHAELLDKFGGKLVASFDELRKTSPFCVGRRTIHDAVEQFHQLLLRSIHNLISLAIAASTHLASARRIR